MKTIDEIKDQIAKKHGYDSWNSVLYLCTQVWLNELENEAMQEYARVCCVEQYNMYDDFFAAYIKEINNQSIDDADVKAALQMLTETLALVKDNLEALHKAKYAKLL